MGEQGVKDWLGFNHAFNNSEFKNYNIDFGKFDKILFFDFKNDVRNSPRDSSDPYDIIAQFKAKVNYPESKGVSLSLEPSKNNLDTKELAGLMAKLRGVKTKDEIELVRKAVSISCLGQIEVMIFSYCPELPGHSKL